MSEVTKGAYPRKCGWLAKQGGSNKGWKRRWCVFDQLALSYFKSEQDKEYAGVVYAEDMKSISIREDESKKDVKYPFCFEVETPDRAYMFSADSREEMDDWIRVIKSVWEGASTNVQVRQQFATVECFVDSGVRVNGQLDPAILAAFSEGANPKQKRKDERGWFVDKYVPCATVLQVMSKHNWALSSSFKTQSFVDAKQYPVTMLVFTRPYHE